MLHTIAHGGTLGTSLFRSVSRPRLVSACFFSLLRNQSITASPYLPTQYGYGDFVPTQSYYAFAIAAGCPPTYAYGNSTQTIFACLQAKSTEVLQRASNDISTSGVFGSWGFLPVTDGTFIQETPSQALLKRKVNGLLHLTSNMAEEGPAYTPQTIETEDDLTRWMRRQFPLMTEEDVYKVLNYYPYTTPADNKTLPTYPTAGDSGATAVTVSQIASGNQQRANAILGETTFMCPSYWLAAAFSGPQPNHHAWKYEYAVPTALHGYDLEAYFGPARKNQGPKLTRALQTAWGNFVRFGNPSIPSNIANGGNTKGSNTTTHPLEQWPEYTSQNPRMAVFNQTGGTAYQFTAIQDVNEGPLTVVGPNKTVMLYGEPGLQNAIRIADAYAWEGGRGVRCDFWRSISAIVPE